ncbi:MAG: tetratricopeptide repeat protein [Pirellulales bacterium]|nr:tetratricopeptide repeat protein [Pirellulales bacterium]
MPLASPLVGRSLVLLAAAIALLAAWAAADWYSAEPFSSLRTATYVGRQSCIACHQAEAALWHGSNHDRAMELATDESVLGDFNDARFERLGVETRFFRDGDRFMVQTEGPDGQFRDYEVKYTFGVNPLQQYMVEFPDGRIQVLRESWDVRKNEWFFVTPEDVPDSRIESGDPLHWTGLAQNWNTMCAECHTTDYRKNYDPVADTYQSTYNEIDVSCEMCHGPGSVHVKLAEGRSLFWDRNVGYGMANTLKGATNVKQVDTCAPCHSRRAQVHGDYHAGANYLDHFEPALLEEGLYHADGQIQDEVYVYGSFLQSKMYRQGVRCSDCHDPHSLKLKYEGNRLCAQCHQPGKYDTPNHHRHVAAAADAAETQCVSCHMPTRTYMVVDDRHDHSMRVPRPDLTAALGTPNACNNCHTKPEEDAEWAAEAVRAWYGEKRPDDPRWAAAIAAGRAGEPGADEALREWIGRRDAPAIVRATAIELAARYPGPDALAAVERSLRDDSPLVRSAAVRALPLPPPPSQDGPRDDEAEAALNPWGQTRSRFIEKTAPMLRDGTRSVRLATAHRMVEAAGELAQSEFRAALDEAVEEFRAAQQLHLERASAHLNLASLALRLGELPQAIAELRAAIAREPYLTGPRGELARLVEAEGGDADEVRALREEEVELLTRDTGLLPGNPTPYYRKAMLLYLLGDLDEARRSLVEACRLGPNDYQSWLALALICERQQKWPQAVAALERMTQLAPDDPTPQAILARINAAVRQEQDEAAAEE